ncbi:hypothetical protein [Microscilla marina]|nr:hypothetical protein [Microscilla marina]
MRKLLYSTLFLSMMAFVFSSCKKDETTPTNPTATLITEGTDAATSRASVSYKDQGEGTGTTTWTKDKVYILDGLVFVNDGQTLTIEAGTVIKGKPGEAANASALVVARGGKIQAVGTATEPIIFTAESDKLDGSLGTQNGLWGGLIVLGKAGLNSGQGQSAVEGIPDTETRGLYGGTIDTDNSGTLKYVSIRHGGTNIGANNEINGLTLGGVGSGTTIDYVEVFANQDDGIEFFGGTVSVTHAVVSHCGDDNIDYDEGYRGENNQFFLIYQATAAGDRGGEHDGGTSPEDGTPYATPKFYNITYVGNGSKRALTFRDNAGGKYYNSIFFNWDKGIDIEYIKDGESSKKRFDAKDLLLENNTFSNITAGTTADKLLVPNYVKDDNDVIVADKYPAEADRNAFVASLNSYFATAGNTYEANAITRANVVPANNNTAVSTGAPTAAAYRGAFAAGQTPWYNTWTALAAQNLVQ